MLLRWSLGQGQAAEAIEAAVGGVLADGYRTRDLLPAGPAGDGIRMVGTKEMARIVASGSRLAGR